MTDETMIHTAAASLAAAHETADLGPTTPRRLALSVPARRGNDLDRPDTRAIHINATSRPTARQFSAAPRWCNRTVRAA